ncbi:MAG: glutamate-5-semialdehyde dehydrogenase [Bdellovibrionales bacterium]|jgi:glutamate-5-semialdehyde dehydrogenase|nr:glutamate-5-semialdehyde dehydrogenase [Bdellovibrionales bacterium]
MEMSINTTSLENRLLAIKRSARKLFSTPTEQKNQILEAIADRLIKNTDRILSANSDDLTNLDPKRPASFADRLLLNKQRIESMATSIRAVASLPDPVGEIVENRTLENGLKIKRVRSPLGAVLMIFESRPNVITEVFSLAFKSGNAIVLRGGRESKHTAQVVYEIIGETLKSELPIEPPFMGIEDYDRGLVGELLKRNDIFDVCIPRGGTELIERVSKESRMPVLKNDKGICHVYVHETADLEMARRILINAKTQRPAVCNAAETLLIDQAIAKGGLARLIPSLHDHGVRFFCCSASYQLLQQIAKTDGSQSPWSQAIEPAVESGAESHFLREHLDLILNVRIVKDLDMALEHIEQFGSKHSEAIIANNESVARRFQAEVDSACVYWNASTRFTDGFTLGLGGEIGISTQKLHVRGPVGLRDLTIPRWIIDGQGQIRE